MDAELRRAVEGLQVALAGLVQVLGLASRRISRLPDEQNLPPFLASLGVVPASPSLDTVDQTVQLVVTGYDNDGIEFASGPGALTYQSSNPAAATVSATGLVTAVGNGIATITIDASPSGLSVQAFIDVTLGGSVVDHVNLTPVSLDLIEGGSTGIFTADPEDASNNNLIGRAVTWETESGGSAVCSVSGSGYTGTVTPVAQGTDRVRAVCETIASPWRDVTVAVAGTMPNEPVGHTAVIGRTFAAVLEEGFTTPTNPSRVTVGVLSDIAASHAAPPWPAGTRRILSGRTPVGQSCGSGAFNHNVVLSGGERGTRLFINYYMMADLLFDGRRLDLPGQPDGVSKGWPWIEIAQGNQSYIQVHSAGQSGDNFNLSRTFQNCVRGSGIIGEQDMNSGGSENVSLGVFQRGRVYRIQELFTLNTGDGVWDGKYQGWVGLEDGPLVQKANRTTLGYIGSNTNNGKPMGSLFDKVKFNPTYVSAPSGAFTNPVEYFQWFIDALGDGTGIYVSTDTP